MNTSIKGKNLMVFVNGKSIALATSHSLEISANTADVTTKDSVAKWVDSEVTTMQWTLSSENLVSVGNDGADTQSLMDLMMTGTAVGVKFGLADPLDANVPTGGFVPNDDAPKFIYSGNAIITSLSLNAPNGERATFSVTFTGVGALTKEA